MRPGPAQLWPDVAPQWILSLPEWLEELCFDVYKSFIFDDRYMMYVEGLCNTLLLTALALLMGIVVLACRYGLDMITDSRVLLCGIPVAVGVVVYALAAIKLKAITREDCLLLPKGAKIAKILHL